MKMDRNINSDGTGKYAVINMRKLKERCGHVETFQRWTPAVEQALKTLQDEGVLEWGRIGDPDEFFLIKLKDANAEHALLAYADQAQYNGDAQWAEEVINLAERSGANNPLCKTPD